MINVFQPALGQEELAAVEEVFNSNWVGRGGKTWQFEADFADFIGVDPSLVHSINSCTEGLFQAMTLLEIGPGDEVVLPTISFVGAGNAVAACGAKPVFCDVDFRTLNTGPSQIEQALTSRTKAVIILHYGGVPCDLDGISKLLKQKNIPLIEDSACSVASRYYERACGTIGDIALWSFDAMKILVSGDGGMVYCRDEELSKRLDRLLYLGLVQKSGYTSSAEDRWWEFQISEFGRRSVINDITAAIAVEQLKKLPAFIGRRKEVHDFYDQALGGLDWLQVPPQISDQHRSSYYLYWIQTPPGVRDELARYLLSKGVYTTFRYYPLHLVAQYEAQISLPNAEKAARETLCIPIHQSLTDDEIAQVVGCIQEFGEDRGL